MPTSNLAAARTASIQAFFVLIAIALSGCTRGLSREQAGSIIQSNPKIAVFASYVPIYKSESFAERAAVQGVSVSQKRLLFFAAPDKIFQGDKLLAEVDPSIHFEQGLQLHMLRSKTPLEVAIEVTGITEDPNAKGVRKAEFTWRQNGIPSVAKRFAANGVAGGLKTSWSTY